MLPLVVGELSWLVGVGFVLDLPPILLPLSLLGLSKSVRSVENIFFSIKALFYFYKKKHLRTTFYHDDHKSTQLSSFKTDRLFLNVKTI